MSSENTLEDEKVKSIADDVLDSLIEGKCTTNQARTFLARSVSEHARKRVVFLIEHCLVPNFSRRDLKEKLESEIMTYDLASEFWEWVGKLESTEKRVWDSVEKPDMNTLAELLKIGPNALLWTQRPVSRFTFMHEIIHRDNLAASILFSINVPPIFGRTLGTLKDSSGRTALHMAAYKLRLDHLKHLLPLSWLDIKATDRQGRTMLHILLRRLKSVRVALDQNREVEGTSTSEQPEVQMRACFDVVQCAIARDPDLSVLRDSDGYSVLDYALSLGDAPILGALVAAVRPHLDWKSLLHQAIVQGQPASVTLFAREAMATWAAAELMEDKDRRVPNTLRAMFINVAVSGGRYDSLHALLNMDFFRDALNVPAQDSGKRPLEMAVETVGSGSRGGEEVVRTLLVKGSEVGFTFESPTHGCDNVLALAAKHGNVDVLRLLVLGTANRFRDSDQKAIPERHSGDTGFRLVIPRTGKDGAGYTSSLMSSNPLCAAAGNGQARALEFLVRERHLLGDLLDWPDGHSGLTPLHAACAAVDPQSVTLLLHAGVRLVGRASPTVTDAEAVRQATFQSVLSARRSMLHVLESLRHAPSKRDTRADAQQVKAITSMAISSARKAQTALSKLQTLRLRNLRHLGAHFHKLPKAWGKFLGDLSDGVSRLSGASKRIKSLEWALGSRSGHMPPMVAAMLNGLTAFTEIGTMETFSVPAFQSAAHAIPEDALAALGRAMDQSRSLQLSSASDVDQPVLSAFRHWAAMVCELTTARQAAVRDLAYLDVRPILELRDAVTTLARVLSALMAPPLLDTPINTLSRAIARRRTQVSDETAALALVAELSRCQAKNSPDTDSTAPFLGEVLKNVERLPGAETNALLPYSDRDIARHWWWDAIERGQWMLVEPYVHDLAWYAQDTEMLCMAVASQRPSAAVELMRLVCTPGRGTMLAIRHKHLEGCLRNATLDVFAEAMTSSTLLLSDWRRSISPEDSALGTSEAAVEDLRALRAAVERVPTAAASFAIEGSDMGSGENTSEHDRRRGIFELIAAAQSVVSHDAAPRRVYRSQVGGVLFLAVVLTEGTVGIGSATYFDEPDSGDEEEESDDSKADEAEKTCDRATKSEASHPPTLLICVQPNHMWEGLCFNIESVSDSQGKSSLQARLLGADGHPLSSTHTGPRGGCAASPEAIRLLAPRTDGAGLQWETGNFASSALDRFLVFPPPPEDLGMLAAAPTLLAIVGDRRVEVAPRTFEALLSALDGRIGDGQNGGDIVFHHKGEKPVYASEMLAAVGKTNPLQTLLRSCRRASPVRARLTHAQRGSALARRNEDGRVDVDATAVALRVQRQATLRAEMARRRYEQLLQAAIGSVAQPALAAVHAFVMAVQTLWTCFVVPLRHVQAVCEDRMKREPKVHMGSFLLSAVDAELLLDMLRIVREVSGEGNAVENSAFLWSIRSNPLSVAKEVVVNSIKRPSSLPVSLKTAAAMAEERTTENSEESVPAKTRRDLIKAFHGFYGGAELHLHSDTQALMGEGDLRRFNNALKALLVALHDLDYASPAADADVGDAKYDSTREHTLPPSRQLLKCIERWIDLGLAPRDGEPSLESFLGDDVGAGAGGDDATSWIGVAEATVAEAFRAPVVLADASGVVQTVAANLRLFSPVLNTRPLVPTSHSLSSSVSSSSAHPDTTRAPITEAWVPAEALPIMCLDVSVLDTFWTLAKRKVEAQAPRKDGPVDSVARKVERIEKKTEAAFGYGSDPTPVEEELPDCMYLSLAAKAAAIILGVTQVELCVRSTTQIMTDLLQRAVGEGEALTTKTRLRLETMFQLLDDEGDAMFSSRPFYEEYSSRYPGLNRTGLHIVTFLRAISLRNFSHHSEVLRRSLAAPTRTVRSPHSSSGMLRAAVSSGCLRTVYAVLSDYLVCRYGEAYMTDASYAPSAMRESLRVYVNSGSSDLPEDAPPLALLAASLENAADMLRLLVTSAVTIADGADVLQVLPSAVPTTMDDDASLLAEGIRPILDVNPCGAGGWSVLHSAMSLSPYALEGTSIDAGRDRYSAEEVLYDWQERTELLTVGPRAGSPSKNRHMPETSAARAAARRRVAAAADFLMSPVCALHVPACFQHGANIPSPLDMAARASQWPLVEMLLARGALGSLAINAALRRTTCFSFAHEAALFNKASVFTCLRQNAIREDQRPLLKNILFSFRSTYHSIPGATKKTKTKNMFHEECPWFDALAPAAPLEGEEFNRMTHSLLHDAVLRGHEDLAVALTENMAESFAHAVQGKAAIGKDMQEYWHFQDTGLLHYVAHQGFRKLAQSLLRRPFYLSTRTAAMVPFPRLVGVLIDPVQMCLFRGDQDCLKVLLAAQREDLPAVVDPAAPAPDPVDMSHSLMLQLLQGHFTSYQLVERLIGGCVEQRNDSSAWLLLAVWVHMSAAAAAVAEANGSSRDVERRRRNALRMWKADVYKMRRYAAGMNSTDVTTDAMEQMAKVSGVVLPMQRTYNELERVWNDDWSPHHEEPEPEPEVEPEPEQVEEKEIEAEEEAHSEAETFHSASDGFHSVSDHSTGDDEFHSVDSSLDGDGDSGNTESRKDEWFSPQFVAPPQRRAGMYDPNHEDMEQTQVGGVDATAHGDDEDEWHET